MGTLKDWIAERLADPDPNAALAAVWPVADEQRRVFDACTADGKWPNNVDQADFAACVLALEAARSQLRISIALAAQAAARAALAAIDAPTREAAAAKLRSLLKKPPASGGATPPVIVKGLGFEKKLG